MAAHISTDLAHISEAVRVAKGILSGQIGVLEGCIPLSTVANRIVPDWWVDPDFVVFGGVASEIDALPLGSVREMWSSEALERKDVEVARYTQVVRERVMAACRSIVDRFGPHVAVDAV
jgi:hypothetical protein